MSRNIVYAFAFILVVLASCKKTEEVIVPNNTAPPDNTISNESIESYYNRLYITLLGRKPTPTEADSVKTLLTAAQLSLSSRQNLIQGLQNKPEYLASLYTIARADLLNALDTSQITLFIAIFNQQIAVPSYSNVAALLQVEVNRLVALRNIPADLANHSLTPEGMERRCIDNYFYDQLNMGTENFVVSSFQHFLLRYPSAEELSNGKLMVDGFASNLFYQSGTTKNDYMNIFFASDNFKEGTARELYKRYLFKEPSTTRLYDLTQYYKQHPNYQDLQREILSSDEYTFY
ncbi:MAG: hypothetical protein JST26_17355 [Bacteroidetes bacterium]|nr:hypothetical protein [Bacteroidota bacterium]